MSFTLLILTLLAIGSALELWLLARQAHSIATHRDQVPVQFRKRISLQEHQRGADYNLAKIRLARLELGYAALLLLLWTLGGGIDWLAKVTSSPDNPLAAELLLMLLFFLLAGLLDLPFSLYRTFVLEQRFGFNRTSIAQYIKDGLLQLLLGLLIGGPLLSALLWLMQRAGDLWWAWGWLLWSLFSLLMIWAYPTLIAPLFNRFQPLPDSELKQRIESLLQRCGFSSGGIFVMDGSRRSGHGNAYFTGLGRHKRIVFFDTLLESLQPHQVEAVLAHELGHYHHRHVQKHLLLSLAGSLLGFALLGWLKLQPWFYHGLGVETVSDATALLLFLLVAPLFTRFISPLLGALLRHHEYQADAFAAEHTSADALVQALVQLYRDNAGTLTPDSLYSAFHDSHPPASLRVGRLSDTIGPETDSNQVRL